MSLATNCFIAGAVSLLLSMAAFGGLTWRERGTEKLDRPLLTGSDYVLASGDVPLVEAASWNEPLPLARGRDWVYDVFTPPEIFYHTRSRQFVVVPPPAEKEPAKVSETEFGVELVAVHREPFRLQLIGYVGEGPSARGVFENHVNGEVFLATIGRQLPELSLSVVDFKIRADQSGISGNGDEQRLATAVVRDEKLNEDVILTQRERHPGGSIFALVAASGSTALREVRAGEGFEIDDVSFRVEAIYVDPPAIDLMRSSASDLYDRRTLSPRFVSAQSAASLLP